MPIKKLSRFNLGLSAVIVISAILSACSSTAPSVEASTASPSPKASPTRKPTFTAEPTATVMPSPTATADPTNTPTPTLIPPPDDFSKIRLVSFGQYPDWRFQFTFEFPSPVKGSYKVQTVNPRKEFPCRPLLEYNQPKRMVCLGRTPAVEKVVDYNVVDTASGAVLFSGQVSILFQ